MHALPEIVTEHLSEVRALCESVFSLAEQPLYESARPA